MDSTSASIRNSYNSGNVTANISDIANSDIDLMVSGITASANNISNVYNTGNVSVTSGSGLSYNFYSVSGIVGRIVNINNTYNTGLLTYSPYNDLYFDEYAVGPIVGNFDYFETITNNKYLSSTSSTPGIYIWDIDEPYEYSGDGITAVNSINDMPSVLSIVNVENKYKSDDRNINGGYPLLKWQ